MMHDDSILELRGRTVWDRGHRYGSAAVSAVRRTIAATYETLQRKGHRVGAIRRAAASFRAIAEIEAPDLLEEMEGVAAGASVDDLDIVTVNCRYEMMWPLRGTASTAIAVGPPACSRIILAQNVDVARLFRNNQLVVLIRDDDAGDVMMAVEAGFIGGFGLNEAGVGACGTVLLSGGPKPGLPFRLILRRALQSGNLRAAEAAVSGARRAFSAYYLLGSAREGALGIECTATWHSRVVPVNGVLAHANHFLSAPPREDEGRIRWPDSIARVERAAELATELVPLSPSKLQAILRDHYHSPASICRHAHGADQLEVLTSLVMDVEARRAWFCWGPPCQGTFQMHRLNPM